MQVLQPFSGKNGYICACLLAHCTKLLERMLDKKREHPKVKSKLHPRNKHRERYDLKALITHCPELAEYVSLNVYGDESIDFFNPAAVKMLNTALLKQHYGLVYWDIPEGYLCPPIPGRADYIHHVADLLRGNNFGHLPKGHKIKVLDIGVGANCVYPILGHQEYGWSFIGSDIDPKSIENAQQIIDQNPVLTGHIELRLQSNAKDFFYNILQKEETVDLTICNPPFHTSLQEAQAGTQRKLNNLKGKKTKKPILNFGGQASELCYEGGEKRFVKDMIRESRKFGNNCCWFSTLISKQSHLKSVYESLDKIGAKSVRTIAMGQGNKSSRIVAWTFFTKKEAMEWAKARW